MKLHSLVLKDWRNFPEETFEFEPGLNVITGDNGCGKTNLLEAVGYLSYARSFRKSPDKDLVRAGVSKASVKGIFSLDREKYSLAVEALLSASGKQIRVDGKKVKTLSSFVGTVLTAVFEPKSVFLFKDEPSERRKLMDETLSAMSPKYLYSLQRYRKILKERNQALITMSDEEVLSVLTAELIRCSYQVAINRLHLIQSLDKNANVYFRRFFDGPTRLRFTYKTNTLICDSQEEYQKKMEEQFNRKKSYERIHRTTIIGPHRDDLAAYLDDKPLGSYGSQGQNRLASLAVTLALAKLIKEKKGEDPILILDDVLSDLDSEKQGKLLETAQDFQQVLLSGSSLKDLPKDAHTILIGEKQNSSNVDEGGKTNV